MKKIIIYISSIVVAICLIDVLVGISMRHYVNNYNIGGDYTSLDYLLKDFDEDILILGSSVSLNSLDPKTISDSIGYTTYNGASNGQTFSYQLVMLKSVLNHHIPKVVILGQKPSDLSSSGSGNRINFLSPYYGLGYEAIDSILDSNSAFHKTLMKSSLYRFNTIWFRMLLYQFIEPGVKGIKGFIAKDIPSIFPQKDVIKPDFDQMSNQRLAELSEIIALCKSNDIKLILFFPPQYIDYQGDYHDTPLYRDVSRLITDNGMYLYDDTSLPAFASDSTLFYDNSHLNVNGASLYTKLFTNRLANDSILQKCK